MKWRRLTGIGTACGVASVFRIEEIGRFAAASVDETLALPAGRVKSPRRDESQATDGAGCPNRWQTASHGFGQLLVGGS